MGIPGLYTGGACLSWNNLRSYIRTPQARHGRIKEVNKIYSRYATTVTHQQLNDKHHRERDSNVAQCWFKIDNEGSDHRHCRHKISGGLKRVLKKWRRVCIGWCCVSSCVGSCVSGSVGLVSLRFRFFLCLVLLRLFLFFVLLLLLVELGFRWAEEVDLRNRCVQRVFFQTLKILYRHIVVEKNDFLLHVIKNCVKIHWTALDSIICGNCREISNFGNLHVGGWVVATFLEHLKTVLKLAHFFLFRIQL